jgi:hypothetical protein
MLYCGMNTDIVSLSDIIYLWGFSWIVAQVSRLELDIPFVLTMVYCLSTIPVTDTQILVSDDMQAMAALWSKETNQFRSTLRNIFMDKQKTDRRNTYIYKHKHTCIRPYTSITNTLNPNYNTLCNDTRLTKIGVYLVLVEILKRCFPTQPHVPYGLCGLPSRLWPKCKLRLRFERT